MKRNYSNDDVFRVAVEVLKVFPEHGLIPESLYYFIQAMMLDKAQLIICQLNDGDSNIDVPFGLLMSLQKNKPNLTYDRMILNYAIITKIIFRHSKIILKKDYDQDRFSTLISKYFPYCYVWCNAVEPLPQIQLSTAVPSIFHRTKDESDSLESSDLSFDLSASELIKNFDKSAYTKLLTEFEPDVFLRRDPFHLSEKNACPKLKRDISDFINKSFAFEGHGLECKFVGKTRMLCLAPADEKPKLEKNNLSLLASAPTTKIFYGPPGTGKSRHTLFETCSLLGLQTDVEPDAGAFAAGKARQIVKTQFHASYSYEDFVEGIRPVRRGDKVLFELVDGPFLAACHLAQNKVPLPLEKGEIVDWARNLYVIESFEKIISRCKTVEGRPIDGKNLPTVAYYSPFEEYVPIVLIIDEINRGNTAKIFGEVLTAVEEDYRCRPGEVHPQSAITLQHSKRGLTVPTNLHLIATMNSADRSLAELDQAFRRRFSFYSIRPNFTTVNDFVSKQVEQTRARSAVGRAKSLEIQRLGRTNVGSTAQFLADLFIQINKAIPSFERHLGQSYAFKALSKMLQRSNSQSAMSKVIIEEVVLLWLTDILPQIRLIPPLWTYSATDVFAALAHAEGPFKNLVEAVHGQVEGVADWREYWECPPCLNQAKPGQVDFKMIEESAFLFLELEEPPAEEKAA